MATPGSNELKIDAGVFLAIVVVSVTAIVLVIIAWIYTYHVLKDRAAERKKKRQAGDVEWGRNRNSERNDTAELPCEEKSHELEQPGTPELDSREVRELWVDGCAKEMDGRPRVVELDAEPLPEQRTKEGAGQHGD